MSNARGKGSRRIIWLTYRHDVSYKLLTGEPADEAFVKNNQTLRDKVASGALPDVLLRVVALMRSQSGGDFSLR